MSTDLHSLWGAIQRRDSHEIASHLIPTSSDSQSPRNRFSSAPAGVSEDTTADFGAAKASILYPVTCRARYYDAASTILEDELHLFNHANANELGAVIEQWIATKRNNWEPR